MNKFELIEILGRDEFGFKDYIFINKEAISFFQKTGDNVYILHMQNKSRITIDSKNLKILNLL